MKCPQCRMELPEGSRFCKECGSKLDLICHECGKNLPSDSKFCLDCGHDLRKPKDSPKIDYQQPQSYLVKRNRAGVRINFGENTPDSLNRAIIYHLGLEVQYRPVRISGEVWTVSLFVPLLR